MEEGCRLRRWVIALRCLFARAVNTASRCLLSCFIYLTNTLSIYTSPCFASDLRVAIIQLVEFSFKSKVWLYPGMAGWHFASVDKKTSEKIKKSQAGKKRKGWGSVPVTVTLGKSTWKTSIFPDKDGTYLLPLKAQVRKKEGVFEGDTIRIKCTS